MMRIESYSNPCSSIAQREYEDMLFRQDELANRLILESLNRSRDTFSDDNDFTEIGHRQSKPASRKTINKLPRTVSPFDHSTNDCVICQEIIEVCSRIITLPCSHIYHEDCIVTWLKTGNQCPLCRKKVGK